MFKGTSKGDAIVVVSLATWPKIVFQTEALQTIIQEDAEEVEVVDLLEAGSTTEGKKEEEETELNIFMIMFLLETLLFLFEYYF